MRLEPVALVFTGVGAWEKIGTLSDLDISRLHFSVPSDTNRSRSRSRSHFFSRRSCVVSNSVRDGNPVRHGGLPSSPVSPGKASPSFPPCKSPRFRVVHRPSFIVPSRSIRACVRACDELSLSNRSRESHRLASLKIYVTPGIVCPSVRPSPSSFRVVTHDLTPRRSLAVEIDLDTRATRNANGESFLSKM